MSSRVVLDFMDTPITHVKHAIRVATYATVILIPSVPLAILPAIYSQHPQQIHDRLARQDTMNILITLVNLVMIIEQLVASQVLTNAILVQMVLLMSLHHLGYVCVLLATLTVMAVMM